MFLHLLKRQNSSPEASIPLSLPTKVDTDDLLGLNADTQDAAAIEDNNALALALISSGTTLFDSDASQSKSFDPSGWELALVTTPSTNLSSVQERQLGGGLDLLTLDSLYDEGSYRASQQPVYGAPAPNPFEQQQPTHLMMSPQNPFGDTGFGAFPPAPAPTHPPTTNPFGSTDLL
ncbi:putative clathrin assembly protein [Salvia divinorum]|uniref:Clathrin assembly protein n=1 Tax=Salvia divinorum TaxID=28513 RepID=A0ABD1HN07_SALDI